MEYHARGNFEDASTYAFCNRGGYAGDLASGQSIYKTVWTEREIVVSTQFFTLAYVLGSKFDEKSLTVTLNHPSRPITWGHVPRVEN